MNSYSEYLNQMLTTSTRLDGQRGILRPFAHRAVVEHQTFLSKPAQQEQINGRRNAAPAIGDDLGKCVELFRDMLPSVSAWLL
jgi:hypothetical protein